MIKQFLFLTLTLISINVSGQNAKELNEKSKDIEQYSLAVSASVACGCRQHLMACYRKAMVTSLK